MMSVNYLRDAVAAGDAAKLVRFVRLHLGDGNEDVGRKEIEWPVITSVNS